MDDLEMLDLTPAYRDSELGDYQEFVDVTSQGYMPEYPLQYAALGLAGETGEVVERIKKIARKGEWSAEDKEYLILELGDVIWYVTRICNILDVDLDEVLEANIDKLNKRREGQ